MATNFTKPGNVITMVAPTGGTTTGVPVVIGGIFGIPETTELVGVAVEVAVGGQWTLTKEAPLVIGEGAYLFWDEGAAELSISGVGQPVAIAVEAALSAATTVEALLLGSGSQGEDFAVNGKFRAVLDVPAAGLAAGDHAFGPFLPNNATVVTAIYDVTTTFTSAADTATIGIGFDTDDVSGIVAAVAIGTGTPYDAGLRACIQDGGLFANVAVKLTASRQFEAVVAVQTVTAGRLVLFGDYVVGE